MDDEVAEAAGGAEWERLRMNIGLDVGWRHAGAIIFDGELEKAGDGGEGDADFAGGGSGRGTERCGACLSEPDGFGCVAHQVDGDALDDFGREVQGRKRGWAGDDDGSGAGSDALENGRQAEQRDGVVGRGCKGVETFARYGGGTAWEEEGLGCCRAAWGPGRVAMGVRSKRRMSAALRLEMRDSSVA